MAIYRGNVTLTHPNMGGVGINSWHVRTTPVGNDNLNELNQASAAIKAFYTAIMLKVIASDTQVRFDGDWVAADGSGDYETSDAWNVLPYSAGAPFPPHMAICAGWGTAVRNRTGYGRTFLGPLRGQACDDQGTPSGDALTAIRDAMDALIASSTSSNGWAIGIYSRKLDLFRDVTSRTVHDQFAVLRSRRA